MKTFKERFGFTKRHLASIYRKAAKLIEIHGLRKGEFGRPGYGFCTIGALRHAGDGNYSSYPLRILGTGEPIMRWNDKSERTQDEVIGAFRKAARLLEHGAVVQ